jgi:hypothetical protein
MSSDATLATLLRSLQLFRGKKVSFGGQGVNVMATIFGEFYIFSPKKMAIFLKANVTICFFALL